MPYSLENTPDPHQRSGPPRKNADADPDVSDEPNKRSDLPEENPPEVTLPYWVHPD